MACRTCQRPADVAGHCPHERKVPSEPKHVDRVMAQAVPVVVGVVAQGSNLGDPLAGRYAERGEQVRHIYLKLGIPTVASALWTTQQVKRYLFPDADGLTWSDGTGSLHLVEVVVPDHLAGRPVTSFRLGDDVRPVGLIRGGIGRVSIDGLFAQEDDIMQFMVTPAGRTTLSALLEGVQ